MKTASILMVILVVSLSRLPAAQVIAPINGHADLPPPTKYRMVEQGADHNVWQRETFEQAPSGQIVSKIHKYTELATGLNYQDAQGQWQPSQEAIETYAGGAIARQGQYQVIFADNLNTEGAIDLQTPDKKRLRSNILGLGYYDHSSGQAVLIAQLQDSEGQLIASNQVLYPNAFQGVAADVRYTYKKGKFEQDVILREQPPTPETYGMNPATTELEVMTEFLNPPAAKISGRSAAKGVESDGEISWGTMAIGHGKAFDLGESKKLHSQVSVTKQYAVVDGRQVLIEMVPVTEIQSSLRKLPVQTSTQRRLPFSVTKARKLPKTPLAKASGQPMQLASLTPANQGYVLDYTAITSTTNNFTFQGDTTYYVGGAYYLNGLTTIEGGTVIKMDGSGELIVVGDGVIDCQTSAYHPGVFTSVNDNSVGEPFGSGTPGLDVSGFLDFNSTNAALHDLRFSYSWISIEQDYGQMDVWDSQFMNVDAAVFGYNVGLHNVLIGRSVIADAAVFSEGPSLVAENVTSDGGYAFFEADYFGGTVALTNCLVTGQLLISSGGYTTPPSTNAVVCLPSPSVPVYQKIGGGFYYLTNSSPYRDVGTTNISPDLLADLAAKTTYPPIAYSNATFTTAMTFSPQAQRDNDGLPDLGYHYDPLDQLFVNSSTSSNLLFTAGTAAAWTTSEGMHLTAQVTATFAGTAISPNYWVRANVVQEQDGNADYGAGGMVSWYSPYPVNAPTVQATFAHFSELAGYGNPFRDDAGFLILSVTNCEFWTCGEGGYGIGLTLKNCLFDRSYIGVQANCCAWLTMQNCTMRGRTLLTTHWGDWPVSITNCAFDGADLSGMDGSDNSCDYNAFLSGASLLPSEGVHTNIVTSFNWKSSWLGNFYLPTNSPLINKGNTTANQVGLYYFTTQTNQAEEANSQVDVGYHYVATDGSGHPWMTMTNGVPDYLADTDGNGLPDFWEIQYFGHISVDPKADPDYDGANNLQEYLAGTNPNDASSVPALALGRWRFDNTNTWVGDAGQLPLATSNLVGLASWNTNAVLMDTNSSSLLKYRDVETNGHANINLHSGTVRFWFKSDWNSVNQGGSGPATPGRLLEVGNYLPTFTNGWWSLYLNPAGTQLFFATSTNGAGMTNLAANIDWTSNQWHQVALTYTSTNTSLYLDGSLATNGTGALYYPNATERTNGFRLGSDAAGSEQAKGQFDELETFNYPLNASDISSNYQALVDKNGNGLADYWELQNFGHLGVDPNSDPDGDGLSNLEEYENGTNPNHFDAVRLGHWRFDDPPVWSDDNGLLPANTYHVLSLPSWLGMAVKLNPVQAGVLAYPSRRPDGSTVMICSNGVGSIRFWFKPDWASTTAGGNGPGDLVRLLEVGHATSDASYGWFALTVNSFGTKLDFETEANGVHTDNTTATINFNPQNWYQVVLTYTPSNSAVYVNGVALMNGAGVTNLCLQAINGLPFNLGSSWDGIHQANGSFDELETFNYALPASDVAANYQTIMNVDTDGDGLSDVQEDAQRTRLDAMDSDCDGIPDGWEVYHGMNPSDTSDATAEKLKEYMGIFATNATAGTYLGTQTIGIFSGPSSASFGSFPAGNYTVRYIDGAWSCATGDWAVEVIISEISSNTYSITAGYNAGLGKDSGRATFPGPVDRYSSYDDAQTAALGEMTYFYHQGGDISMMFVDKPYDDNFTEGATPTYELYTANPALTINEANVSWLNATQCLATFTILNNTSQTFSGLTVGLRDESGVVDGSGAVTNWTIASYNTASVTFTLVATPSMLNRFTATIDFDGGTNIYPSVITVPMLEARPGKQAVYLVWPPIPSATTYSVYQSIGSTNNWTLLGTTDNLNYQNTNLTVGTTYFYKVSANGVTNISDGTVPFGCPDPLPPILNYMNPLEVPADNGSYTIAYAMLLTNSDAFDPQGYSMVFKIEKVLTGSLMINGSPAGPGNDTIGTSDSVVWTPPAVMVASGTPALRVYVYDGLNASTNKVDVIIQQHPATHLMAWGQNWNQNWNDDTIAGTLLGTGSWHVASGKPIDTDFANEPVFLCQNLFNICPEDPRWTLSETNNWTAQYIGDPPAPVLDLDKATSVASFQSGHAAVTPDKQLWFWGECYSYATGRPLVFGVHTGESTPFIVTNWSTSLNWTTNSWGLLALTLPSPTPVLDPQTGLPMTGVVVAQDDFILKGDGTLWSFGWLNEKLGREVTDPNQIFSAANGLNAIYPGRVEFEGNDDNEVLPGREIAAVCANSGGRDIASGLQGLALCKDGSLWSWGRLCENGSYYFQLSDSMDYAQPARLFDVESASSSPIAQIKESQNHIVIQRQDGSLSELGYIPMWDTNRMFIRNPHDAAGIYSTISDGTPDGSVCYRTIPVVVSNVPANIKQFGVAPSYGVILTESGEVWVWGQWLGQIWPTPHQIPSLAGIIKIAVGQNYIVALDSKGRLWGIGINSFGIFGFNDTYPGPDVSDRGPDFPGVSAHGIIYTNAVRVQGIENVTDIYVGDKDWVSQMYAIGSEIQGKPVGLSALSMNQSVSLSWSNYPAASSYVIYRSISEDGGYAAIGTATVNSYQDRTPPLVNDKIYYYQVSAVVNGIETMPSWDVAATPLPPPKSVQNLMAVDECHAVTLSWEPPLNAAQSPPEEYRIDRADAVNGTYLAIDHNLSGATVYEDITVVAGHTYYYHVVTVNSAGESAGNTAVSGEIDDSTCATSPLISTNWMPNSPGNSWFTVSPPNPYNLYDPNAYGNLCWTGPQAGTWLYAANQVATNRFDNNFLYNLWYYQYSAPGDNIYGFLLSQVSLSDSNTLVDLSISYAEKLPIVLGTLNHLLTNGTSLYSFSPFNTITLRTATVTLKNTSPTGANLVQLNRMLLDDALINDQSFMTGPAWGDDLTGFRVYYRYVFPNGKNSLLLSRDVTLNQVLTNDTARRLFRYDDPLPVVCYQFRWPILDGAQYWASVAAIIGNQVGNTSIEAGPLASSIDPGGWQNVRPRVISGYHQVYLDWPDDSTLLNFTVKATALPPSADANSGSFDYLPDVWVGLSTNQTDVRYWHVSTPTNFTLVDFKYPTDLANRLVNGLDLVSTLVWTNFSPSAQDGLSNAYINSDSTQARTNLAAELTRIIQNGSLIFTTNQAGMVAADLSTQTRALLARHDASDPTFTAADLATLNRLLLEDAYVVDIARYETPSPVEFVSGDFNAIEMSSLLATKFANYGSPPVSDHMGSLLWNWLSPTATNEIMAHWNDGSATNILAMQRLLAKELTRIIQTNAILFTTNDVVNYYGWGVSRRAMELAQHTNTLGTNEISLLNRLLLQDAWNSYGVNNYGVYPYSYVEPLSDLRCYWIEAYFCDYGYPLLSDWAQARPDDRALPPPSLSFSADAFAYDSMTLVQWNTPGATNPVPGSDTTWQFSVERREGSAGAYANVTKTGFGLAYSDVDVLNDHAYQYRVTAYDTNYNRYQAETSLVTPANSASLTLFDPQPGNGYVDLSWTPIRATQFTVMHSTSPDGPFESVAVLNGQNAYQNAQSTYRHVGVLNGVIHYYKIVALTPTGAELDSDVKSATPLPTLATLPPDNFQGQFLPDDASGQIILSWTPRSGATSYQVFLSDQTRFTPLSGYNGLSSSCNYIIPIGTPANTVFTFAVRSINAQNLAGDLVTTIVTNLPIYNSRNVTNPVVLQVADFSGTTTLMVLAPTNLTLSATVSVPSVDQVNFYDNGQIIGTVGAPYQMTWYHVPAGLHSITAAATVQSDAFYGGSSPQTFTSDPVGVNAIVAPELSAYQTSATDLQLPAPALPISLARSYTSRSTDTNGILGIGWSAGWSAGSVKLSGGLGDGWVGLTQTSGYGYNYYYFNEIASHYVTVTLPGGGSVGFSAQPNYIPTTIPEYYDSDSVTTLNLMYQPFGVNQGTLNSDGVDDLSADDYTSGNWNGAAISFDPSPSPSRFTYTGSDGTAYLFAQSAGDSLTWLLTSTTDRSGNSLNYAYDPTSKNLLSISNSCGRAVNFTYTNPQTGVTNISVYDPVGGMGGAPVVVYVVSNNLLTEVHQLVTRTNTVTHQADAYQTNRYAYGTDGAHPADLQRITDAFDARGIQVLHNTYTNNVNAGTDVYNGDLAVQITPGRTNTFQVDASFDLTVTTISSTATNTAKVTSDASGAISGATQPVSGGSPSSTNATSCSYDSQGNLISQTDANGNTKTYTYDDQNRLVGQADASGSSTSTELNDFGQPTISTDANGQQTLYQYDNVGNPINVRDPSGTATGYTYSTPVKDGAGNVLLGELQTSQSQQAPFVPYTIVTTNNYDTSSPIKGDLLNTTEEWVDGSGHVVGIPVTTSYQYDANGNRTLEIKSRTVTGGIQYITNAYTYDAMNRVVMTVVSAGGAEILLPQTNTVTYNLLGKQFTSTDAASRTTTNVYDFNGNLIETDYPDGTVSRTSYDAFGRQQYVQERAVAVSNATTAPATFSLYDASGRVIETEKFASVILMSTSATTNAGTGDYSGPGGQLKMVATSPTTVLTTNLTFYDAVGQVQYSVDARGAVTENRYDAAGRLTNSLVYTTYNALAQTGTGTPSPTASCQSTTYTYDANGNQITVTDAAGHTTTSVYDNANRVKEMQYPAENNGTVSRFTYYDGLGRKIQESDEAGVNTAYTYDFRGLLTSVTLAFGTTQAVTTVYSYDELGNEIRQTDANGHATTNRYDALGHRTARLLPGGQSEGYAYDRYTGNLLYQTNFNGVVITNQYDFASGRLTNCSAPNYQATYAYSPTGLRTNMTDVSGVTAYFYNGLSQLTNKTVTWSGHSPVKLNYGYDALDTLTNLYSSTANGVSNAYQYDVLGRLTNVLANGSSVAGYGFDVVGNLQTLQYANGVTNLYQYDVRNRLTNVVWKAGSTALASFGYTVGPTGNRTASAEAVNGVSRTYAWNYDYLYRLTSEGIQNLGTVNYQFDAVGNRTSRASTVTGIGNQSPTFTANDWLASDKYDNNGNTTNSVSVAYQYDVINHLTNVNSGSILITYDGDGNRVKKTVGSTTTYYLVDDRNPSGYVQVLEEWTSMGTPALSRVYNYGMALISQRQVSGSVTSYYGTDGHGSTRLLLNTSGLITDTYAYDAYGLLVANTGSTANNYLYCGQQFDSDLGMYYLRARYYKPDSGRFWTMDSYEGNNEDPSSLHKYLYCQNAPINLADLSGNTSSFTSGQAAAIGRQVHQLIGQDFTKNNSIIGRWTGASVFTIANLPNPVKKLGQKLGRLFPDLVDDKTREVYEIKPVTIAGTLTGFAQLYAYVKLLNKLDPPATWHDGNSYDYKGGAFSLMNPPCEVIVLPTVSGMIYYEALTIQQLGKAGTKMTAKLDMGRLQQMIGVSTMLAVLGGI